MGNKLRIYNIILLAFSVITFMATVISAEFDAYLTIMLGCGFVLVTLGVSVMAYIWGQSNAMADHYEKINKDHRDVADYALKALDRKESELVWKDKAMFLWFLIDAVWEIQGALGAAELLNMIEGSKLKANTIFKRKDDTGFIETVH